MEGSSVEDDLLSNLHEKLESGFYLDKISIDGIEFEVCEKTKECLVLSCDNGSTVDGSCLLLVRLPLPLRFDEEWFMKYKKLNIKQSSIISYVLGGYINDDLKE